MDMQSALVAIMKIVVDLLTRGIRDVLEGTEGRGGMFLPEPALAALDRIVDHVDSLRMKVWPAAITQAVAHEDLEQAEQYYARIVALAGGVHGYEYLRARLDIEHATRAYAKAKEKKGEEDLPAMREAFEKLKKLGDAEGNLKEMIEEIAELEKEQKEAAVLRLVAAAIAADNNLQGLEVARAELVAINPQDPQVAVLDGKIQEAMVKKALAAQAQSARLDFNIALGSENVDGMKAARTKLAEANSDDPLLVEWDRQIGNLIREKKEDAGDRFDAAKHVENVDAMRTARNDLLKLEPNDPRLYEWAAQIVALESKQKAAAKKPPVRRSKKRKAASAQADAT